MAHTPSNYTDLIKKNIEIALSTGDANPIAAFDADGTCWLSDVGRDFFDYQIAKKFFVDRAYEWLDYDAKEKEDITIGLFWLAEILAGFPLEKVRAFGHEFNKNIRPKFLEHQREIIKFLLAKNIQVYIVTASVKWTVEAAAAELGIPHENVIGIQTEVENGIITKKQKGHLTWASGKVDALLAHTNGKKPFFVSGNTMSDEPMMRISSHLRQVVHATKPEDYIYASEQQALKIAKEEGWHYLDFTNNEFK